MNQINDIHLENISSLLRDMYRSVPEKTRREKDEGLICLEVDLFLQISRVIIVTYIFSDTRGNHYFNTTEEALAEVNRWYFAQSYGEKS
jgi:hypothetical protein